MAYLAGKEKLFVYTLDSIICSSCLVVCGFVLGCQSLGELLSFYYINLLKKSFGAEK